ncbi:hypothetical protein T4E_5056 [Trichinella pseudospiralis]|uniref:Uncharacterized protein n=1 Tax=Trichinella pseudospiralis TaxID=6337 RepID=A0A0V0YK46_TRIPS|nr:hypothetical protein T4E_5056 [Trichinella pseudospiralis]
MQSGDPVEGKVEISVIDVDLKSRTYSQIALTILHVGQKILRDTKSAGGRNDMTKFGCLVRISITVNKDDHGRESLQQQFCLACKPSYMRQWGTLCLELCLAAWQIYTIFASVSANSARQQERNLEEQAHSIAVDDGEAVAQKGKAVRNNRAHSAPDVQPEELKEPVQKTSCTL